MKRNIGLSTIVLVLAMFAYAQDQIKVTVQTGWICNSKCVHHEKDIATCDVNCNDKSGYAVFVDEHGKSTKINNPDKVKGHMGEKMKVKSEMMDNGEMQIDEIIRGSYGF
jgi:hypothetical protein